MTTTPKYVFPVPNPTDPADGPTQILALAQAVENLLSTGNVDLTGGTIKVKAPTLPEHPVTKALLEGKLLIGPVASAPTTAADGTIYFGY